MARYLQYLFSVIESKRVKTGRKFSQYFLPTLEFEIIIFYHPDRPTDP